MAIVDYKKVLRDEGINRADISSKLLVRQLGHSLEDKCIGYKNSSGEMSWYTPEGGDASFNSITLSGLVSTGFLFVNSDGEIIAIDNIDAASGEAQVTSVISGGEVAKVDDTTVSITAGTGVVVDSYTDPENISKSTISWDENTGYDISGVIPAGYTGGYAIYIDNNGNPAGSFQPLSRSQRRTVFALALINYDNGVIVDIFKARTMFNSQGYALNDYLDFLSLEDTTKGNNVISQDVGLQFHTTSGEIFQRDINYDNDILSPNVLTISGAGDESTAAMFSVVYKDGTIHSTTNTVPKFYEPDPGGSFTTLSGSKASILYVYTKSNTGEVLVQPGQNEYSDISTAINNLDNDLRTHETSVAARYAVLRAQIYIEAGASSFDGIEAGVVNIGDGGGGGATSLQNLADVLQQGYDAGGYPIVNVESINVNDTSSLDEAKVNIKADLTPDGSITVSGTEDGTGPGGVGNADGVYTYLGTSSGQMTDIYQRGADAVYIGKVTAIWIITNVVTPGLWTDGEYYLNAISPIGTYEPIGGSGNSAYPVASEGGSTAGSTALYTDGDIQVDGNARVGRLEIDSKIGMTYSDTDDSAVVDVNGTGTQAYSIRQQAVEKFALMSDGTAKLPQCVAADITEDDDVVTKGKLDDEIGKTLIVVSTETEFLDALLAYSGVTIYVKNSLSLSGQTLTINGGSSLTVEGEIIAFYGTTTFQSNQSVLNRVLKFKNNIYFGASATFDLDVTNEIGVQARNLVFSSSGDTLTINGGSSTEDDFNNFKYERIRNGGIVSGNGFQNYWENTNESAGSTSIPSQSKNVGEEDGGSITAWSANTDYEYTVTVTGAVVGNFAIVNMDSTLYALCANNTVVINAYVSAANQVKIQVRTSAYISGINGAFLRVKVI